MNFGLHWEINLFEDLFFVFLLQVIRMNYMPKLYSLHNGIVLGEIMYNIATPRVKNDGLNDLFLV